MTEPDKNRRGRPARVFRLPDLTRLCAAFGVHWTESDPLKAVDLSSVRRYREALHRELIKRRPGVYTVEWLSERFGVSRRSVQRYSRQFGLLVDPHYIETPITWETLSNVPEDEDDTPEWVFLCDEDGHYYPAVRPIARRLLNQEKRVSLMRQTGNVYRHISHYAPQRVDHASKNAPKSPEKGVNSYGEMWLRLYGHEARKNPQNVPSWVFALLPRDPDTITPLDPPVPLPDMPPNTPPPVPRRPPPEMPPAYEPQSRRYYRQPLPDAEREQTAQWLYDQLRIGSTDNEKKSTQCLSMVSARRLADEFAAADIRKAVTIVRARRNVRNPAGFVTAYVRQQHRARVRRIAAERQRYFERYPDAVADAPSQIDLL